MNFVQERLRTKQEGRESREKAIEEEFERTQDKRHRLSAIAVRLERTAEENMDRDVNDLLSSDEHSDFGSRAHTKLEKYWSVLQKRTAERKEQEARILEKMELGSDEESLGVALYHTIVMHNKNRENHADFVVPKPKGKVRGLRKNHFFILQLEDSTDYAAISSYGDKSGGEHYKNTDVKFKPHPDYETVSLGKSQVIIVKGEFGSGRGKKNRRRKLYANDVVRHEEAHAFNHGIFRIHTVENDMAWTMESNEASDHYFDYHGLKDELLAFLKDGTLGIDINDILLDSPLYQRLYDDFPDEKKPEVKKLITQICQDLDQLLITMEQLQKKGDGSTERKRICDLVYYQLLDIPLPTMPHWLTLMISYYEGQATMLDTLESLKLLPKHARFGTQEQPIYESLVKVGEELETRKATIIRDIFVSGIALRENYGSNAEEAIDRLYRGNSFKPYLERSRVIVDDDADEIRVQVDSDRVLAALADAIQVASKEWIRSYVGENNTVRALVNVPADSKVVNAIQERLAKLNARNISIQWHSVDALGVRIRIQCEGGQGKSSYRINTVARLEVSS